MSTQYPADKVGDMFVTHTGRPILVVQNKAALRAHLDLSTNTILSDWLDGNALGQVTRPRTKASKSLLLVDHSSIRPLG